MAPHVNMVRICPACHRAPLRPVVGGLGKMGNCHGCGYTGPLRTERAASTDEEPPKGG